MVGKLLFVSPLVVSTDYDLFHTAEWSQKTMEEFKDNPENEEERAVLDKLLHASLRTDLMEVIQISRSEKKNDCKGMQVFIHVLAAQKLGTGGSWLTCPISCNIRAC